MRKIRPAGIFALATVLPGAAAAQTLVLPEIVVSADRIPFAAERTGSSVSVVTEGEIAAESRPFALDYLADLPGVTVQQAGPPGTLAGLAIRGAPQQYVRTYVDGIEVSDPTGAQVAPALASLLAGDLSRIEVLKGSQSALYGGQAVGGVINLTTARAEREGIEQRLLLEGGAYDSVRGGYTVTGRDDRGEFALSLLRLKTDGFSAAEEADGNTEDDGYATTRASASGRFRLSDTATLSGAAFVQDEEGDFDGAAGPGGDAPNTFDTDQWGALVALDVLAFGRLENRLAFSRYAVDSTTVEVSAFGRSTFETDGHRDRIEYLGRYGFSDALTLQFGADWSRERTETTFTSTGFVSATGDLDSDIYGGFAQGIWSPSDRLTLNAALRQDQHSEFGGYTTGRLTAAFGLTTQTTLRGSLGTGFRPPSNYELFGPFGTPGLEPETSRSADLGLEQRFQGDRGRLTATLFWLEIEDLIVFDGATSRYAQSDGTSESKGLELGASYDLTDRLTLSGAYTYADAKQAGGARRDRIPRHQLAVDLDGAVTDRISLGLGARYVADYVDNSAVDATGVIDSAGWNEDYVVVDAKLAYAVTDRAELYLRAENVLDEQYQTARGYSTADRSFYFGLRGRF